MVRRFYNQYSQKMAGLDQTKPHQELLSARLNERSFKVAVLRSNSGNFLTAVQRNVLQAVCEC
jgi:hypothetical protein